MFENRLKQFETSLLSCFSTGVIRCGEFLHTSRDNGAIQKFGWQVQSIMKTVNILSKLIAF